MIKVYHYNSLTKSEEKAINGPNGGWDSTPRFARYADITSGHADLSVVFKALLEGEYHAVAVVETDERDIAFRLTNHIEDDWTENKQNGITVLPGSHRSTSVGDIMEETETGAMYVVAPMGFVKVES